MSRSAKPAAAASGKARTAKARVRAPGRPAAAEEDLRERLLDAALACFSRHGIAATPLRTIATEAGVNPALLHYYFGDRARLQQAVIDERVLPVFTQLREPLLAHGDDTAGLVAGFVLGIGRIVGEHPWLPSLWVREVLCEGGALRDLLVTRLAPQLPRMMVGKFADAQAQGRLNPDLDPRLLMVSLIGLTLFPAAGAPIWRRMFDADDLDYEALRRHTLVLLDRGLECG
ncbi:TetR family transcriptional regulator [Lysobacter sp. F6437]|uniref:TetR family transcriptional regulator n=1 Tax=Lysobacter sp. F6437 TaxID=3459296 RepID=UPI00403DEECD